MARYIDADAVKLKVQRYLIPNTDVDGTVDCAVAERWFLKLLDEAPTTDVVPKSEVEMLGAEAQCLRNANADLALALLYECTPTKEHLRELEKAVREKVAREIFAEIEWHLRKFKPSFFINAPQSNYDRLIEGFAELKKKYME